LHFDAGKSKVKQAIKRKLFLYLQAQNLSGFRALLNLQRVHLRGFSTDALSDLVPGFPEIDGDNPELQVARFLFQTPGFASFFFWIHLENWWELGSICIPFVP